jgi:large subunit ribosomal protein L21
MSPLLGLGVDEIARSTNIPRLRRSSLKRFCVTKRTESTSSFPVAKRARLWNFGRLFLPRETMAYAIIRTGGRQFRVEEGDTLDVDVLDVEPGKTATFGDVLMFADGKNVTQGNPLISGANVTAEVLEQRKDKKVVAFKYKRRKGYHRTVGHRRKLTRIKIKSISVGAKKSATKKSEE